MYKTHKSNWCVYQVLFLVFNGRRIERMGLLYASQTTMPTTMGYDDGKNKHKHKRRKNRNEDDRQRFYYFGKL